MSLSIQLQRIFNRSTYKYFYVVKRTFLSPKFICNDAWEERLSSPIFKRISIDDFYHDIEQKYNQTGKISAIDMDIFTNACNEDSNLDELEDLIHKFRLSAGACKILPSTHHGFIRTFFKYEKYDELMRILNDRLNYGIFPDDYCTILILDKFIKDGNYKNAAKVATMHMLQEDFSNKLISLMSIYSCHKYLLNPSEWESVSNEEVENDDEEVKVRVKYLRNPYFDDHFDLTEANHLIGKTLGLISERLDLNFSKAYQLLGNILYEKWSLAQSLLQSSNDSPIPKDILKLITDAIEALKNKHANDNNKLSEVNRIYDLVNIVKEKNLVCDDALASVEDLVKEEVKRREPELIEAQLKTYKSWINSRDLLLNQELEKNRREMRLEEVRKAKEALKQKEEELFFFDRENELDLKIESKKVKTPDNVEGSKKKKSFDEEEYIPPEITKQKELG